MNHDWDSIRDSNRIREIRKEKKLSGEAVASKLNISTQYLYDIEKGKRTLSAENASKLADIFGVTVDYLLGKTENSDQHSESELAEIPIETLNNYKLVYKGHTLSKEEADDIIELLEAALKRWKK
ncbi:helix-turn-helix domain-containing protein [Paenibacillus ehimensis]|uniref:Helix-turn-helix transcriptional regulator n=1 Tax=Paenibacillus ehimensis TaxID=79264 RepID=A0ABT8VLW1_9BACL|nr:helix-turn-helix transcriptional regulator [Paenibacillus ehimensis]MDO3681971.1 helix-turn-helix transcriptional regulator [Paenibacillus ehimensis]